MRPLGLDTKTVSGISIAAVGFVIVLTVTIVCATSQPVRPQGVRRMKVLTSQPSDGIIVPLWWDTHEDAFMIECKLGQTWVSCVFDTGCSSVSAKGSACHSTHCPENNDVCHVQSCP